MNDSKKITFAVVGCGHIGKRHIEEIKANQNSELIAVCDVKTQSEFEDFGLPFLVVWMHFYSLISVLM